MTSAAEIISLTLLHSLWQAAFIAALLLLLAPMIIKRSPAFRKKIILAALCSQLIISILTAFNISPGILIYETALQFQSLRSIRLAEIACLIYFSVLLYKLSGLFKGLYSLRQLELDTRKAPVGLRIFTEKKTAEFSIKRKVRILLSDSIKVPCTFGFWKPAILFPVALITKLSTQQIEMLILHELGHIRNKDFIINLFLSILEAIYFFNPFMLRLIASYKLERESDCDQLVMQHPYTPVSYASTLAGLASGHPGPSLAAVSQKEELLERIKRLPQLKKKYTDNHPVLMLTFIAWIFIALTILLPGKENPVSKSDNPVKVIARQKTSILQSNIASVKISENTQDRKLPYRQRVKKVLIPDNPSGTIRKPTVDLPLADMSSERMETNIERSAETEDQLRKIVHRAAYSMDFPEKTITLIEERDTFKTTRYYRVFHQNGIWYYNHLWTLEERTISGKDSAQ